jgi:hypothetical protein
MAINCDFGNLDVRAIRCAGKNSDGFRTALDNILSIALNKHFADEVGFGKFGSGREVRGVVGFC